jgi:nucleoside-diphosphate-sugar epimerase
VREAVQGCERVYHLAALVSTRDDQGAELFEVNVLGTQHVMNACLEAGVRRVVHTSSIGAVGLEGDGPSTEESLVNPFGPLLPYELTKMLGEAEALRAGARGLDVVIVNPSSIVGPHDYRPSPLGRAILDFHAGRIPAYVPGAFDFVHVEDVVRGHVLAMERGRRGERYLLCGEQATLDAVFQWLSELLQRPAPRFKIPPSLMLPIATTSEWVRQRLMPHRVPALTPGAIQVLCSGKRGTCEKARRELAYDPVPARQAFHDAVHWLRAHGRLPS